MAIGISTNTVSAEDIGEDEILELEKARDRLIAQQDMRQQSRLVRDVSTQGDQESALAALETLIAQKRSLE